MKSYKSDMGVPSERIEKRIAKAAALRAQGVPIKAVAKQLSASPSTIRFWPSKYPSFWSAVYAEAQTDCAEKIIAFVRDAAGNREKMFADPENYLRMADYAMKLLAKEGKELFPANGKPTLSTFFRDYYHPVCMVDPKSGTIKQYEIVLKRWALVTGDPPLEDITPGMMAMFRDFLSKLPAINGPGKMSRETVRAKLRTVGVLLRKAGPPGQRNYDAAGIIEQVPWCRPPRAAYSIPKIVTMEVLGQIYQAAPAMKVPRIPGITPGDWWQALVAVAFNTALRKKTLLTLEWADVDWESRQLTVPEERMKSGRPHVAYLNATCIDHLRRIQTDRGLIFPWPYCDKHFTDSFKRLQDLAGIPPNEFFGLHTIRRTAGTALADNNLLAAQSLLGHQSDIVTRKHYVDPRAVVAKALDKLKQPKGFL